MAIGVETGLILGIVLSAFNILVKSARPRVIIYVQRSQNDQHIYVKPSSGIFFPGIDYIREQINIALIKTNFKYSVIMDLAKISSVDFTSLQGFEAIVKDLKKFNLNVKFINVDENLQRRLCFNE
jgi:sodium-independent sulfate anion transporter 11